MNEEADLKIELSDAEREKNRSDMCKFLIITTTFSPIPLLFLWVNATLASGSVIYSLPHIIVAPILYGLTGISLLCEIICTVQIFRKKKHRFWIFAPIFYVVLTLMSIFLYFSAAGAMAM